MAERISRADDLRSLKTVLTGLKELKDFSNTTYTRISYLLDDYEMEISSVFRRTLDAYEDPERQYAWEEAFQSSMETYKEAKDALLHRLAAFQNDTVAGEYGQRNLSLMIKALAEYINQ